MPIHHAIVKAAAAKGFILTHDEDAASVTAQHPATNKAVTYADDAEEGVNDSAKKAWADCGDLVDWTNDAERNKGFSILCAFDDGETIFSLFDASKSEVEDEANEDAPFTTLEDAIAYVDAFEAEGDEEAADDEEDEDKPGSVVPAGFKALYKEIGVRGQDNGDFLAAAMAKYCIILDGKKEIVDCDKVDTLASRNGVDYPLSGYNTASRGWQGRYRMTVRNMLAKKVADNGFLIVPSSLTGGDGLELPADEAFRAKFATKPKTKKAKKERAEAAAELAAPEGEGAE